ncbi:MAG: GNAT family N-acetyltransferase [Clostridia bacterium]|nr:GNAT family N-acetyltransferase [Clostridia bacterium]
MMKDSIESERLVLFPYTKENLCLFNSDLPEFEKTYGVVYRGEELDHLLASFLRKLEDEIASDPGNYLFFTEFLIVLKENSHIIGSIDYKYVPVNGVTEVGYGMNPAYTGNGYMTEALEAFLKFGRTLGIKIVRADTLTDNVKSQNVLKRCGFHFLKKDGNIWWETDLEAKEPKERMETERLIIDRIRETDKEDYFNNISHDKKVLETFICRYAGTLEEFDFSPYLNREDLFAIRLKETGRLIGIILYFDVKNGECEIGYGIGSAYWNKGYMTEAVKCFLGYLFYGKGLDSVCASFFTENTASGRVMEKCGMEYRLTVINELMYLGIERDLVYYCIKKEQFDKKE